MINEIYDFLMILFRLQSYYKNTFPCLSKSSKIGLWLDIFFQYAKQQASETCCFCIFAEFIFIQCCSRY